MTTDQKIAVGVVAAYVTILWITRWRFVARANALRALEKIDSLRHRCKDQDSKWLLDEAARYVKYQRPEDPKGVGYRLARALTWNGSRELVAWRLAHEAERREVNDQDAAAVEGRLARGLTEISELPETAWDHWRDELNNARASLGASGETARGSILGWRGWRRQREMAALFQAQATLKNFLKALYDRRNERFVELSTAENKVTWLVLVALLVAVALILQDVTEVLGAGAVGGLLSRLERVQFREEGLSDDGMSWALLFLAPIAGALTAWAGLILLLALQNAGIVNDILPTNALTDPDTSELAVGLVLGFFGRIFERLASQTASATV